MLCPESVSNLLCPVPCLYSRSSKCPEALVSRRSDVSKRGSGQLFWCPERGSRLVLMEGRSISMIEWVVILCTTMVVCFELYFKDFRMLSTE